MRALSVFVVLGLTVACGGAQDGERGAGMDGTAGTTSGGPTSGPGDTSAAASSSSDSASDTPGTDGGESGSTSSGTDGTGDSAEGSEAGSDTQSDDGSTGDVLPRGQWAVTEITYTEGDTSETLSIQDRTFCDATISAQGLLLRYQQAGGYTVWSVTIPTGSTPGSIALTQDFSGAYMNINEVGADWQAYFDPSMAFGTLELTDAQVEAGGVVAGTLTASLTSQDGTTTADFESTFYAEIP